MAQADDPAEPPAYVTVKVFPTDVDGFVGDVPYAEVEAAGGLKAYSQAIAADIKARRQAARAAPAEPELTAEQLERLERMNDEYPEDLVEIARQTYELSNRTPDVDSIADEVMARASERQRERTRLDANTYFSTHYAEVESDPDLLAIATRRTAELLQDRPDLDYLEVVKDAGDYARQYTRAGAPSHTEQVVERKRHLQHHVPSQASQRSPPPADEPPQTRSDVIAGMRQQRGQLV